MANPWYEIPEQTKINAYIQISERTGMSAFAVEKDWWVMQALAIIFEMEIGEYLVFKGGTSLSKAWNLIDRFSEDVDLAVDRDFLGFNGELTKKQVTSLRKDTGKYIKDKFYPELTKRFAALGLDNVRIELIVTNESDQDPRIIEIYYPNVIESPGYLQPKVQIEIGWIGKWKANLKYILQIVKILI